MTMEGPDGIFPALLDGIASFRRRVEGDEGDYRQRILKLAGQTGVVATVITAVLETLRDILAWIHQAIDSIDEYIVQADAALSLLQTFAVGLSALADALAGEWPDGLAAAVPVADGLGVVSGALDQFADAELPDIIPRPATLVAIQDEIRVLLGARVDPAADPPPVGSLDELINSMGASP